MAVAGLAPALPTVGMPIVPMPPQPLPVQPYQPGQLLQQAAFPAPSFYGPSSFPVPRPPNQPRGKPRLNNNRPWKARADFQQSSTGVPNFEQLRWENSKKTQRAFGPAAGGFANRPTRNSSQKAPSSTARKLGPGPGVQKSKKSKKWTWKHNQSGRQGPTRHKAAQPRQKPRGFPARAQTPTTILRTPATVQHTPSMIQQTPAALMPTSSHPEGELVVLIHTVLRVAMLLPAFKQH